MSGKFPYRGDFSFPSSLIDDFEWIMDSFIDGSIGADCLLIYPPNYNECENCHLDITTGRSNNIYKIGGPISFENHTLCPICNGEGRLTVNISDSIRLRIYTNPKDWQNVGFNVNYPEGSAQIIGYWTDFPKIQRAKFIMVNSDLSGFKEWKYIMASEALPWGLRGSRYFAAMIKRTGGD